MTLQAHSILFGNTDIAVVDVICVFINVTAMAEQLGATRMVINGAKEKTYLHADGRHYYEKWARRDIVFRKQRVLRSPLNETYLLCAAIKL